MGDISYTPTFHNVDYVDGQDRVKAEGDTGFNARFGAIESDLAQLSTVVGQIDAELDQLESPPPVTRRIVLPLLLLLRTGTAPGWVLGRVGAESALGQSADGSMNLVLPDGVLLESLRATGEAVNVSIAISLSRVPIAGGGSPKQLTSVTADTDPFDHTGQIDATLARVDTGTFSYRIRATVGAGTPTRVTAAITALQLTVTG